MVVNNSKSTHSPYCDKCGGLMRQVLMPYQSETVKFVKIHQCIICRFWHE